MTTWSTVTTNNTAWSTDTIDEGASVLYNDSYPYNADYLTYNGYYINTNTDWATTTAVSTAWAE